MIKYLSSELTLIKSFIQTIPSRTGFVSVTRHESEVNPLHADTKYSGEASPLKSRMFRSRGKFPARGCEQSRDSEPQGRGVASRPGGAGPGLRRINISSPRQTKMPALQFESGMCGGVKM